MCRKKYSTETDGGSKGWISLKYEQAIGKLKFVKYATNLLNSFLFVGNVSPGLENIEGATMMILQYKQA